MKRYTLSLLIGSSSHLLINGLFLICVYCAPLSGDDSTQKTVHLLTIGNSFSDNATEFLDEICQSQGVELILGKANLGGSSLEKHAAHLQSYQRNTETPDGRPYRNPDSANADKISLIDLLKSKPWNYITIQQFSGHSYRPETFEPHAGQLIQAIRKHAPQAQILVHQTWAYRIDHSYFSGKELSQERMYEKLTSAYDELATNYDLKVIPVGDAFQIARSMPRFYQVIPDPNFDYDNPPTKKLPDQRGSLVVGWHWRKTRTTGTSEFRLDAKHANTFGRYLAACVFFERITDMNSRELTWLPEGLKIREAIDLRHAAHQAVTTRMADEDFVHIFNGNNFEDWDYDPRYWRVENGIMVGEVTPDLLLDRNSFMIWRGGTPANFELKVEYRVSMKGNSGLSYRNVQLDDAPYSLSGYQADIDGREHDPRTPRQRYVGQAWEERGRRFLARRGEIVQIDKTGQSVIVGSLGNLDQLESYVKDDDWNEYHIIIRDNVLIHMINGHTMSVVIDNDPVNRRMEGLLGVQVHTGPPQKIEFRNFRLKEL